MKLSTHSQLLIESALKEAVSKFAGDGEQTIVTDIHLLPKQGSGELIIFDDEDEELAKVIIEEWTDYCQDDFSDDVEKLLTSHLNKLKESGTFNDLAILKPYSFVLVDEDKETISDLLLMDDDTFMINDELLKGLDKELDEFLTELLEN